MAKTLIVLNPHAGGGRAGHVWPTLEPLLRDRLGELVVAVTQRPDEVAPQIDAAYADGIPRVISVGGDGTNHALINALADLNARQPGASMVYGSLPMGTGRDWARGAGIPMGNLKAVVNWITSAQPRPTDVGLLTFDGRQEYFLNIASAGMGGEVAARVNRSATRRPWTFLTATIATLLHYQPRGLTITLDGAPWFDGPAYFAAIANGTTFGHGMKIAPRADIHDGRFDVVVLENASKLHVLMALRRVYDGSHLTQPEIHYARAAEVGITSSGAPISLELDGEVAAGRTLAFQVRPAALQLLT